MPAQANGKQGMMMMMVVVGIAVVGAMMCSSIAAATLYANSPASSSSKGPKGTVQSPGFGSPSGDSEFEGICPDNTYAKSIDVEHREVGPLAERHDRINRIRVTCSDGSKKGTPSDDNDWIPMKCDGGISGANLWTTSVLQRIQPKCRAGKTPQGIGSGIGDRHVYDCPDGKRIVGVGGWYSGDGDVDNIRLYCRDYAAAPKTK